MTLTHHLLKSRHVVKFSPHSEKGVTKYQLLFQEKLKSYKNKLELKLKYTGDTQPFSVHPRFEINVQVECAEKDNNISS